LLATRQPSRFYAWLSTKRFKNNSILICIQHVWLVYTSVVGLVNVVGSTVTTSLIGWTVIPNSQKDGNVAGVPLFKHALLFYPNVFTQQGRVTRCWSATKCSFYVMVLYLMGFMKIYYIFFLDEYQLYCRYSC